MLRQRVWSAVVLIPVIFIVIWFAPPWLFSAVFGIVILLAVFEFYRMVAQSKGQPFVLIGLLFSAFLIANAYFGATYTAPVIAGIIILSLIWLILFADKEHGFDRWVWTLTGILYIGWLSTYFILLRNLGGWDSGRGWVIITLFAIFATDTSAYFIGRAFGRHKMAPSISPAKTWEGAAGGFVGGLAATVILALILSVPVDWKLVLLGCIIPVFSQLGDLAESLFKRGTGVKDAGKLIPGHGGILDRLDSIIFTAVAVYYYIQWVLL